MSARVCKVVLSRIHAITNGRLDRALKAQADGGSPHNDQRGHHTPPNKTSEASLAFMWEHISSFPKYKSHYSRSDNSNRHYLSPDLTINKRHQLYSVVFHARERSSERVGVQTSVHQGLQSVFSPPCVHTCMHSCCLCHAACTM